MRQDLSNLQKKYSSEINSASTLKALDGLYLKLFGKSGEVTLFPKGFSKLEKSELKIIGPLFNKTKKELESALEKRRDEVKLAGFKKILEEPLGLKDVSAKTLDKVVSKKREGHMHPITQFEEEIVHAFAKLGFQQFDAPHIDTDVNNFQLLNMPKDHPARDLQDTLYIDSTFLNSEPRKFLLRTQTSNGQIPVMKKQELPIRMLTIGRCFRFENLDARHEHTFEQFELVYVDKGLSLANLLYLSEYFFQAMFGYDMKARLRPKYYPFVEPGAGVDGLCIFCKGKGCKVCGGIGWLEIAGAGMIHPTVLRNGGIDPDIYSGIAWGMGIGRILMIKEQIKDIRVFNSGNLNLLKEGARK